MRGVTLRTLLPWLLAKATGAPRYLPRIEWAKEGEESWTHNVFRLYELVFYRRYGIRPEVSAAAVWTREGLVIIHKFHTLEAAIAHGEGIARQALKAAMSFELVALPRLVPAGANLSFGDRSPYLFAIANNASGTAAQSTVANTVTISINSSGSERIVCSQGGGAWSSSGTITGVTHNAGALTLVDFTNPQGNTYQSGWYRVAQSTGAQNLVTTASSTGRVLVNAAVTAYTGVNQDNPISGTPGKGTATNTTLTVSTTPAVTGCWVVGAGMVGANTITASTGITSRSELDSANGSIIIGDSNGTVTGGASYSMTITCGATDSMGLVTWAIAPPYVVVAQAGMLLALVH